jgi:hypothetical protein
VPLLVSLLSPPQPIAASKKTASSAIRRTAVRFPVADSAISQFPVCPVSVRTGVAPCAADESVRKTIPLNRCGCQDNDKAVRVQ